jgi:hypothetical protein
MKKYKKLQIIKHALEYYITRPNATDKDKYTEKVLLEQVTQEVDELKEKYGIG